MPVTKHSDVAQSRPAGAATAAADDMGFISMSAPDLEAEGAAHHPGAALSLLPDLLALAEGLPPDRAGIRLQDNPALGAILQVDAIRKAVERHLNSEARPVRAILIDKSPGAN